MSTSLSLALVGFWHVHAQDYAAQIQGAEGARLVAAWDDDEERGVEGAAALGIPFTTDLDELLARPDVDGVIVTTATTAHTDIIGRAIAAGKHVFTEKLLAPTVEECEQLIAAAQDAGVRLAVSLPRLTEGVTHAITSAIEAGTLGQVTYTRVRLAHDGSIAGWLPDRFYTPADAVGGALTDLGCHAVYLTQLFLGATPETVSAVYGNVTGQQLEDNAVVTLRYPGGALAVIESSNVTTPGASTIEVRGTESTLVFGFAGLGLLGKGTGYDDEKWVEVPAGTDDPLPIHQWVATISGGTAMDVAANNAAAVELTRLVEAANAAASSGRTIDYSLPLPTTLG